MKSKLVENSFGGLAHNTKQLCDFVKTQTVFKKKGQNSDTKTALAEKCAESF
jgi:hypothetical protein